MSLVELHAGGASVALHDEGEGEPVVLVHSSGMSSRQFKLLRAMLSDWRVLSPDLIGYGDSAPWTDPGPFDIRRDVEVVLAAARHAGGPVHLVGHSYGGLLCLRAARELGPSLRSLALYEPVAFGVLRDLDDAAVTSDLGRLGEELFTPGMDGTEAWMSRFVGYWQGEGVWAAMPLPVRTRFSAAAHKTFHEVDAVRLDMLPASTYAGIQAPTLLLQGAETTITEARVCALLEQALPAATLRLVDGAAHLGPLTHAREVNAAIFAHLEAHRAG